jgi:hypothetical protein
MAWRAHAELPYRLDGKRWAIAACALPACILGMPYFSGASLFFAAPFGRLVVIAVLFSAAAMGLLWRNAALTRLLAVKLS